MYLPIIKFRRIIVSNYRLWLILADINVLEYAYMVRLIHIADQSILTIWMARCNLPSCATGVGRLCIVNGDSGLNEASGMAKNYN